MHTIKLAQLFTPRPRLWGSKARKDAAAEAPAAVGDAPATETVVADPPTPSREAELAVVAHELRNAMAPLANVLAIIGRDPSPEVVARVLPMADRQLRQMGFLVNDLLDASRLVNGRVELHLARVTLQSLVDEAWRYCTYSASHRGHEVTLEMPEEDLWVQVDPARLQQVMANLFCNAIKFTPQGGHIHARVWAEGGWACFALSDDGVGIAETQLEHIFGLLQQEDSTRAHSPQGLGIGLALARRLIELHGGTIRAESRGRNQGSTFTARLPLAR